jgi:hypothetical protein
MWRNALEPLWSPDDRQLFYKTGRGQGTTVVDLAAGAAFIRSQPRALVSGPYGFTIPTRSSDISPDGQRFVMTVLPEERPEQLRMTSIHVVLNWFEELRRLAPADCRRSARRSPITGSSRSWAAGVWVSSTRPRTPASTGPCMGAV